MIGKIKWFDPEKGVGFIEHENGDDLFVHLSAVQEENVELVEKGAGVEFEIVEAEKGQRASKVFLQ